MIALTLQTVCWFSAYAASLLVYLLPRLRNQRMILLGAIIILVALSPALGLIDPKAITFILLGLGLALVNVQRKHLILVGRSVLALLCLALATHQINGFSNALVFYSPSFGISELPFSLYANIDKAMAALLLLLAFGQNQRWHINLSSLWFIMLSCLMFFGTAVALGAKFEFKLSELTLIFMALNLLTTCIAEESFFRLVIQQHIAKLLPKAHTLIPVCLTTIIFTLAHLHFFEGYEKRLALIFLAGFMYGWIYHRYGLGSAIIMHFAVNSIHFIFFAYPASFH